MVVGEMVVVEMEHCFDDVDSLWLCYAMYCFYVV